MILEADDITFGYQSSSPVISDWSARFEPGTLTALTGASGRGKSTLLYLLGLMLRPDSGRVLVDGEDFTSRKDSARARARAQHFGFVFQDAALDPTRSVLDNVLETTLYRHVPKRDEVERAHALLQRFGVGVPAHRKPGQVSGGQAQRIALCRALLSQPALILADEPTGNLDPDTTAVVLKALHEEAAAGATVVVVTHSREVADSADREVCL